VSGRVRETLDVDAIARTAAREFVRAFGLEEAQIQLNVPAADASIGPALDQQQLISTSTPGASGEPQ
jgi:hypothetical protein